MGSGRTSSTRTPGRRTPSAPLRAYTTLRSEVSRRLRADLQRVTDLRREVPTTWEDAKRKIRAIEQAEAELAQAWQEQMSDRGIVAEGLALVRAVTRHHLSSGADADELVEQWPVQLAHAAHLLETPIDGEIACGEGKTLILMTSAAVSALTGVPTQIQCVEDKDSLEHVKKLGPVYEALGLEVSVLVDPREFDHPLGEAEGHGAYVFRSGADVLGEDFGGLVPVSRQEAYEADILITTAEQLGFDQQRRRMPKPQLGLRLRDERRRIAFLDESDKASFYDALQDFSLSISDHSVELDERRFDQLALLVRYMHKANSLLWARDGWRYEGDGWIGVDVEGPFLTASGQRLVERMLGCEGLIFGTDPDGPPPPLGHLYKYIRNAMIVELSYEPDRQYQAGGALTDLEAGRAMRGQELGDDLQLALIAKKRLDEYLVPMSDELRELDAELASIAQSGELGDDPEALLLAHVGVVESRLGIAPPEYPRPKKQASTIEPLTVHTRSSLARRGVSGTPVDSPRVAAEMGWRRKSLESRVAFDHQTGRVRITKATASDGTEFPLFIQPPAPGESEFRIRPGGIHRDPECYITAGQVRQAARALVKDLKQERGLPVLFSVEEDREVAAWNDSLADLGVNATLTTRATYGEELEIVGKIGRPFGENEMESGRLTIGNGRVARAADTRAGGDVALYVQEERQRLYRQARYRPLMSLPTNRAERSMHAHLRNELEQEAAARGAERHAEARARALDRDPETGRYHSYEGGLQTVIVGVYSEEKLEQRRLRAARHEAGGSYVLFSLEDCLSYFREELQETALRIIEKSYEASRKGEKLKARDLSKFGDSASMLRKLVDAAAAADANGKLPADVVQDLLGWIRRRERGREDAVLLERTRAAKAARLHSDYWDYVMLRMQERPSSELLVEGVQAALERRVGWLSRQIEEADRRTKRKPFGRPDPETIEAARAQKRAALERFERGVEPLLGPISLPAATYTQKERIPELRALLLDHATAMIERSKARDPEEFEARVNDVLGYITRDAWAENLFELRNIAQDTMIHGVFGSNRQQDRALALARYTYELLYVMGGVGTRPPSGAAELPEGGFMKDLFSRMARALPVVTAADSGEES